MNSFKLTFAANAHSKQWSERELSIDDLRDLVHPEAREVRKDKDGICFVAATLLDGKRNAKSVDAVHLLVYDIDGAQSLEEVDALLDKFDHTAFLYTTHSHKSVRTDIIVDHYEKWAKMNKRPITPTLALMQEYLTSKQKAHLKGLRFDPNSCERVADKGNVYVLHHDPVDKLRVLIPLTTPIEVGKLNANNAKAMDEYKSIYHGVGVTIGFDFDHACSDPCRLFYIPSCPPDMVEYAKSREYDGALLDWTKVARIAPTKKPAAEVGATGSSREGEPLKPEQYVVLDTNKHPIDLLSWWKKVKFDFDIETMVFEKLNDQILKERDKGGFIVTCPYEDEHTQPGGEGTFVANTDGINPWSIYCSHNSCTQAQRKKLDFLKGWIAQGLLVRADFYPGDEDEAFEAMTGIKVHTLPDRPPSFSQEEIVEELTPIMDAADAGELLESVWADLKEANFKNTVDRVLGRVVKFNDDNPPDKRITVEAQQFADAVVENGVTIPDLKAIYRRLQSNDNWFEDTDVDAFAHGLKQRREEAKPFEHRILRAIEMSYAGEGLIAEIRRIAGWYDREYLDVKQKFYSDLKKLQKDELDDKMREHFPAMREQYAKLMLGSSLEILDEKATRKTGTLQSCRKGAFIDLKENINVDIVTRDGKGDKTTKQGVNVAAYWLKKDVQIRTYSGVTFDPTCGNPAPGGKFNLWPGKFYLEPIDGDASLVLNHIKLVWCDNNEQLFHWVMMYFADMFQRPWNKPASAICIMGDEGSGKSIVFDKGFKPILGSMYMATARREQLVGKFNKQAEGKLFWLAEESLFSGDKQGTDVLKDLITRTTMSIEPKGKDQYEIPNHIRFVFTSNRNHPLNLAQHDRRYLVLTANNMYRQNTDYMSRLANWLAEEKGCQMFLHYLVNWTPQWQKREDGILNPAWNKDKHGENNLEWNDLYKPPMTKGKEFQIEASREAGEAFFVEVLRYGRIMTVDMSNAPNALHIEWPFRQEDCGHPKGWFFDAKIRFQNAFSHYVEAHAKSGARYDKVQFEKLWDKYFGKIVYMHPITPKGGKQKKMWVLGNRKDAMEKAILAGLLPQGDDSIAAETPDSHTNLAAQDNK